MFFVSLFFIFLFSFHVLYSTYVRSLDLLSPPSLTCLLCYSQSLQPSVYLIISSLVSRLPSLPSLQLFLSFPPYLLHRLWVPFCAALPPFLPSSSSSSPIPAQTAYTFLPTLVFFPPATIFYGGLIPFNLITSGKLAQLTGRLCSEKQWSKD